MIGSRAKSVASTLRVAIEGCAHGELDKIYAAVKKRAQKEGPIDLLICCGDLQGFRDGEDMESMACPPKYRKMNNFPQYIDGSKVAPLPTIFVGGNHEAANYLHELPHGGWVAPNIYYMGFSGVINFAGVRIAGLSGIYKEHDYLKGHFESPPFTEQTKRSFYHVRHYDIMKLSMLTPNLDIFMSHDWPRYIYDHGDKDYLLMKKPFFREDIEKNTLGNPASWNLLNVLQPRFWFSGHMHVQFEAQVNHNSKKTTDFLALNKCLDREQFIEVLELQLPYEERILKYDPEWLWVTNSTLPLHNPSPLEQKMDWVSKPLRESEVNSFAKRFATTNSNSLIIPQPKEFHGTAQTEPSKDPLQNGKNIQTRDFLRKLASSR